MDISLVLSSAFAAPVVGKSMDAGCEKGGGVLGSSFAGYVVGLSDQNPFVVYSVASYRPHLSHFWVNVIFTTPT